MAMLLARLLLWVNGLVFMGTGLYGFLALTEFASFVGYQLTSSDSRVEFLANYGGLYLFYGAFLCWCGADTRRNSQGLIILIFTSFGLAAGRIVGSILVGEVGSIQLVFGVWEIVTGLLCVFALWKLTSAVIR